LSTIRSADTIVALKDGKVAEIGSHGELMKARGLYYQLVTAQVCILCTYKCHFGKYVS
jgi:ATP-binding cassette subfamily B protein